MRAVGGYTWQRRLSPPATAACRKGALAACGDGETPELLDGLRQLLEPATMGDPTRPLRWVSKSHDKLVTALRGMGHEVSASSIPELLGQLATDAT
jgi:hypothetical protein